MYLSLCFYRSLILALLLVLTACGGGGSGGSNSASSSGSISISGQVIKGLTAGATVTLYEVTNTGAKTQIAVTTTNSSGDYSFTGRTLTTGQVYLIEATGGSYVDEISGITTPLTTPLRAVVVGAANETTFSLSPVSELAVVDVESLSAMNRWSATSVRQSTDRVKEALGLATLHGTRYFDLATQPSGAANTMTGEEINFSFYANIFAGFLHESKRRSSNTTLSRAIQNFYTFAVLGSERDDLNSIFVAGFVKAIEKIPQLTNAKTEIFNLLGLPAGATSSALEEGESSGSVIEPIPNHTLNLIDTKNNFYLNDTDTIFNDRGALLGFAFKSFDSRLNVTNTSSYTNLGFAAVAEVYGTSETAIGRWNGSYYFPSGLEYDRTTKFFKRKNAVSEKLVKDKVYAAGIAATNLPQCGRLSMSIRGKTKSFTLADGLILTIDPASKINVQFVNGVPRVAHRIVLNGSNGVNYTFPTLDYDNFVSIDTPWNAPPVYAGMQFGGSTNGRPHLSFPSGDVLQITGLLSGIGGKKAVIAVSPYITNQENILASAAFETDAPLEGCSEYIYKPDALTSLPSTGTYWYSYSQDAFPWYRTDLSFFANGSPNFPSTGLSASSGLEKVGNSQAGIGVLAPPFIDQSGGATVTTHTPYFYRQADYAAGWPSSGIATYQMVAVTPTILKASGVVVSAKKSITSATLKVYFNQTTVGIYNNPQGTCELSLVENGIQRLITTIYRTSYGLCDGWPLNTYGTFQFTGGVTSGASSYATVAYKNNVSGMATILFSRVP